MPNYTRSAATAKRQIEAAGRTVTLFKSDSTPADAAKPWEGPAAAGNPSSALGGLTVTVKATFVPASGGGFGMVARQRAIEAGTSSGSTLKDIEQVALIAATSLKPSTIDLRQFDSMLDGTRILRVHFAELLKPGDVAILWQLGLSA